MRMNSSCTRFICKKSSLVDCSTELSTIGMVAGSLGLKPASISEIAVAAAVGGGTAVRAEFLRFS